MVKKQPARPEPILWLSDSRGVYIPRDFAQSFKDRDKSVSGVSKEDWDVLEEGPEHEQYWDAWIEVCDIAEITDEHGFKYRVAQDGDCWLIPVGMEWSDTKDWYVWPEDEDE